MKNKIMIIGICAALLFVIFNSGCIIDFGGKEKDTAVIKSINYYKDFLPKEIANLPEDFYPANLTREEILANLALAVNKTGNIGDDIWSGIILVTGDINAVNLVIEPGTIIFVKAHQDDQQGGGKDGVDAMNPHEFFGENYSKNHISINIENELNARGTSYSPIIFTSTAEKPYLNDWQGLSFTRGTLEYAVVEYTYTISLRSSNTTISHCLIRNMLASGAMFGTWPEAGIYGESVSPNITYNYIYNFGHMAVQSFFSEPYIANNIFIQKNTNNASLYEYLDKGENGGLDIHGGNATVEYNFISGGYNPSIERVKPRYGCSSIGTMETTYPVIRYNTIVGSYTGIEMHSGSLVANYNNIHDHADTNLRLHYQYSEPGWEEERNASYNETLDYTNNYWDNPQKVDIGKGAKIIFNPTLAQKISEAQPDWSEFEWLYK